MTIVRALAGWIVFAIVGSFAATTTAALVALITALLSLALGLRSYRALSATVIELATVVFFTALVPVTYLHPTIGHFDSWVAAASQLWLGLTVLVTLLIGAPFTLAIAKQDAPEEIWETAEFRRFNVVITRAWMVSFFTSATLIAVLCATGVVSSWMTTLIVVAGIVVPIRFTEHRVRALKTASDPDGVR
ncbi:hypothetical protein [Williamsia sterculiae]|uniref:Intracellular septation protein A n=1 Tax=Williamsia sterculiae TaxID=1344003 RepID=A0A1N7FFI1_9NOCA|nr:hypothetical protein [Williamsia sterculiae]SIR99072.1 hypothetical protein SAMN05445060_2014 [Williamsia sterculiae]